MTVLDTVDGLLLDLDGVVYTGVTAVPHAAKALARARSQGLPLRFITNNASRTPDQVAERLRAVAVPAEVSEVLTSAQAVARLLASRSDVQPGGTVGVVGGPGLLVALTEQGFCAVPARDLLERPAAVVQGFHESVGWQDLAAATRWVRAGVPWLASNLDRTIPTDSGIAPGNGLLVEVVSGASGHAPLAIAGKPEPVMFLQAADDCSAGQPLVVGDRLDTDIAGGNQAGMRTVLVLTGVHGIVDALTAPAHSRPAVVIRDLRGLWDPVPEPVVDTDDWVACGGSRARWRDGWQFGGDEDVHLARAVLSAGWSLLDDDPAAASALGSRFAADPALARLDAGLRT